MLNNIIIYFISNVNKKRRRDDLIFQTWILFRGQIGQKDEIISREM